MYGKDFSHTFGTNASRLHPVKLTRERLHHHLLMRPARLPL
jgi:hypothetical protein